LKPQRWQARHALRALVWSALLAAVGYLGFAAWGGWRDVVAGFSRVGLPVFALALALSLVNYALRFVRWQMYLRAMGHRVAWKPGLRAYLAGFALTTTPAKAGEAIRAILLKPHAVPYTDTFAALASERLSDVAGVVLVAAVALSAFPAWRWAIGGIGIAVFVSMLVMSMPALWDARTKGLQARYGLVAMLAGLLRQAARCHRPRLLATATALSLVAWGAEAYALVRILQALGAQVPVGHSLFAYSASMLAGAASFMPGGLGGAEGAMVALLRADGVPRADAVSATVMIRLATLWFAVVLGLLALMAAGRGTHLPSAKLEARDE
jgi:uncharacterized protein (TIRG00374 family)